MSPEIFWDLGRWHGISRILTALLSTSDSLQKHSGDQKLYTKAGNTYGFNLGKLVYTNTINRSDKINIRINIKNGFLLSPSEPSTKLIDEITPIKKCKCCTTFVQNLNYTTLIQNNMCVCVRVGGAELSMNKIYERDELRAPNRWGARFVFSTKRSPIYSLNV